MFNLKEAVVTEIIERSNNTSKAKVTFDDKSVSIAVNYERLTGKVEEGDKVIINTTANDLKLGSGGYDFVYLNLKNEVKNKINGHIMKQRYTPWQFPVLSVEEQESPHHQIFNENKKLSDMPVAVGTLHSQLPGFCLTLKHLKPESKITYIMTDGAALPISLSKIVQTLKDLKAIDNTITYGASFGGDYEAVNIFTALIAAKYVCNADVAIITMGPGITGTETIMGFTGMEQGQIINAVRSLEGHPVTIPRISFADKRQRHVGLSHHTVTALSYGCQVEADIVFPELDNEKNIYIKKQIDESNLQEKHNISFYQSDMTLSILKKQMPWLKTMDRGIGEDKEFFLGSGAPAYKVAGYL